MIASVLICNAHLQFVNINASKLKCVLTKTVSIEFNFYCFCALLFNIFLFLTESVAIVAIVIKIRLRVRVRVRVTLLLPVYRQSVRLGDKPLETQRSIILFSNWTLPVIFLMWHPLWREDGSVVYNCCWSSPSQSFSGSSPVGLMTTFYCLRFETPPTWRARSPYLYPPGTGWPRYNPRHWVPFSSPPTTRKATVEVFDPTSTRYVIRPRNTKLRFKQVDRVSTTEYRTSRELHYVS
jgi:hypothetical protein